MQNTSTSASNTVSDQRTPTSLQLALAAAQTADDNRGQNIVILDMREQTPIFDYFVIVSGASRRQLHAISEAIDHTLEDDLGDHRLSIEGYQESRWILLDYGDVVIHIFDEETREYFSLEQLWAGAKPVPFEPESRKFEHPAVDRPASPQKAR